MRNGCSVLGLWRAMSACAHVYVFVCMRVCGCVCPDVCVCMCVCLGVRMSWSCCNLGARGASCSAWGAHVYAAFVSL